MDYFYCPQERISKSSLTIEDDEFAHLTHVMRKKVGDVIRVVDGMGTAYDVELKEIAKQTASGTILNTYRNHNEPAISVTVAVGMLKNPSKFDFLVEKVTEIGVREIVPLHSERTIPSHAKTDRWQKLALAAMKQSCRSYLPIVRDTKSLDEFLRETNPFDVKIIAHEKKDKESLSRITTLHGKAIVVLIGPEGGFTDDEVNRSVDSGYQLLYLGERRLRTETAAIVTASMILTSP
jgi:16S rRNA (uracil1498-N3)-methyltransferase